MVKKGFRFSWGLLLFALALGGVAVFAGSWAWAPSLLPRKAAPGSLKVYGQMVKQGSYDWTPGLTARGLVLKAGGPTQWANLEKIKVIRPMPGLQEWWYHARERMWSAQVDLARRWEAMHLPGSGPQWFSRPYPPIMRLNLRFDHEGEDFPLQPGDLMIATEKGLNY